MNVEAKTIRIGIISEHVANDGIPLASLLHRYFDGKIKCVQLHQGAPGNRLESKEYMRNIAANIKSIQPDLILIIRDLDSKSKEKERKAYFEKCCALTDLDCIFLLFRYSIEALAWTDFEATKAYYGKEKEQIHRPNNTADLKKDLQAIFAYRESDIRDLVHILDIQKLYTNYPIWKTFIDDIKKKVYM